MSDITSQIEIADSNIVYNTNSMYINNIQQQQFNMTFDQPLKIIKFLDYNFEVGCNMDIHEAMFYSNLEHQEREHSNGLEQYNYLISNYGIKVSQKIDEQLRNIFFKYRRKTNIGEIINK
jgi:hypothetical protein